MQYNNILDISLPSLNKIIKSLGFRCKKKAQNRKYLCETSHTILKCHEFPRKYTKNLKSEYPNRSFLMTKQVFSNRGKTALPSSTQKMWSGKTLHHCVSGGQDDFYIESRKCFQKKYRRAVNHNFG